MPRDPSADIHRPQDEIRIIFNKNYSDFTLTATDLFFLTFGKIIVKTPFFKDASDSSLFTSMGKTIEREKLPQ